MSVTSSMFMYSLTLQAPSMITQAIVGSFIADKPKDQQVITAQGSHLNINSIDRKTGQFRTILSHNTFSIIRRISTCRIPGTPSDLILVASDSGRVAVMKYDSDKNRFERIHLETFGKSGVRRTIPGQYLATDPRGRCCMFASAEKNKVVYILNRNQEQQITISSPQEVNQPQTLTFDLCAVDTNFQNPVFAALEVCYTDIDQDPSDTSYNDREKLLVYYRVDLGLNHVVREWAETVDYSSNKLFPCPGGADGPGGVLVCGLEVISYRQPNHDILNVSIPRRRGPTEDPERKRRIVAGVMHRSRENLFFLLQTDDGDVFKLTMVLTIDEQERATGEVEELRLVYFDTFPIATDISILKMGFLFLAAENGDSYVYRFLNLGNDIEPIWSSNTWEENGKPIYFLPHEYENVAISHTVSSLNPQKHTIVEDLEGKDDYKIYTTAGTGNRSSFKTITHGLEVNQFVKAQLPSAPSDIWAVPSDRYEGKEKYLVLAFSNVTMFLEVGAETKEVHDHGLRTDVQTIHMGLMGDNGMLQVWDRGFRYYTGPDNPQPDWPCLKNRTILKACTNHQQLCLALSSGEILYFEVSQDLRTMQQYDQGSQPFSVSGTVMAMSMGQVPEGRVRAPFLVIGTDDSTIRVLSLDPSKKMLESVSIQSLTSPPRSIEIMAMEDSEGMTTFVHVGLYSGVYLRAVLDEIRGEIGHARSQFLGAEEVKLSPVLINDQPVMLACSTRTFMSYPHPDTKEFVVTPLDYLPFHSACMFRTDLFGKQAPQSVAGLHGSDLCIFSVLDMNTNILTKTIPLNNTPRGFARHPQSPFFNVIQSDANTLPPQVINKLLTDPSKPEHERKEVITGEQFRLPRGNNYWSSCIQVVNPLADPEEEQPQVLDTIVLEDNEAALCCAAVPFTNKDGEYFLLVGTGKNIPTSATAMQNKVSGFVHVYRFLEGGAKLKFEHKTEFDRPIVALMAFQGRTAIGVGNDLFIYDMGMKSLLRKTRCRVPGSQIVSLSTQGSRIVVGDIQESVFYVVYKHTENKLIPFADDSVSRWTTTSTIVDYDTVAGGDKFGNLWIVRCPKDASEESDEAGAGTFLLHEKGYLGGTSNRLALQVHNFCQDIPTSIQKTAMVPGGQELLFWAGLQGTLGILVPVANRQDVEFFTNLEAHLRSEDAPLTGRDHLMYRGYYAPVKGCIDGDLVERYFLLSRDKKEMIAAELESEVRDVEKKIGEMRTRVAF
ncbi:pre-mRNA-splicing factor rse1 [Myriangium duriaei CBS 260.36]|uniref:Pre-mRNA-splicing factor rse1 n=1 Tax=Myriangium duriaei CBS 260.36 TaxID=1168546 RepID=A0A9P4IR47_9PEZI|nr:pre-mRNA-splicing factor rse1 [Myriangium duriaei CBS 260.36]